MKCITLSGGFDSALLYFEVKNIDDYDFVFIDYNQSYMRKELEKAEKFCAKLKINLKIYKMKNSEIQFHETMYRRNFKFIMFLNDLGYTEIVMGCRNVVPWIDEYKDSNWLSLKLFGWLYGVKIKLPIVFWTKKMVIDHLQAVNYTDFYNCYFNKNDPEKCECSNCQELRRIGFK